jgi:hypothetical protein
MVNPAPFFRPVPFFRIGQRPGHVDPHAPMLLLKIIRQIRIGHPAKPIKTHGEPRSPRFSLPEQHSIHRPLCKPAKADYDLIWPASLQSSGRYDASTTDSPCHGQIARNTQREIARQSRSRYRSLTRHRAGHRSGPGRTRRPGGGELPQPVRRRRCSL